MEFLICLHDGTRLLGVKFNTLKFPTHSQLKERFNKVRPTNTGTAVDNPALLDLPDDVVVLALTGPYDYVRIPRPYNRSIIGEEMKMTWEDFLAKTKAKRLSKVAADNGSLLISELDARETRPWRRRKHVVQPVLRLCCRCKQKRAFGGDPTSISFAGQQWVCSACRGISEKLRICTSIAVDFSFGEQHSLKATEALTSMLNQAIKRGWPEVASVAARAMEPLLDPQVVLLKALKTQRLGIIVSVLGHIQREAIQFLDDSRITHVKDLLLEAWDHARLYKQDRIIAGHWREAATPIIPDYETTSSSQSACDDSKSSASSSCSGCISTTRTKDSIIASIIEISLSFPTGVREMIADYVFSESIQMAQLLRTVITVTRDEL